MRGIFQNFRSFDACTDEQIDRITSALCDGESPQRVSVWLRDEGIRISATTLSRWRAELYLWADILRAREKRAAGRLRLQLESSGVTPAPDSVASNATRAVPVTSNPDHHPGA